MPVINTTRRVADAGEIGGSAKKPATQSRPTTSSKPAASVIPRGQANTQTNTSASKAPTTVSDFRGGSNTSVTSSNISAKSGIALNPSSGTSKIGAKQPPTAEAQIQRAASNLSGDPKSAPKLLYAEANWEEEDPWQTYRTGERNAVVFYPISGETSLVEVVRGSLGNPLVNESSMGLYISAISSMNHLEERYGHRYNFWPNSTLRVLNPNPYGSAPLSVGLASNSVPSWATQLQNRYADAAYERGTIRYNQIYGASQLTNQRQQLEELDIITAALTAYHETSQGKYGDAITAMFAWPVFNRAGIRGDAPWEILGSPNRWNYHGVVEDLISPNLPYMNMNPADLNDEQLLEYYGALIPLIEPAHIRLLNDRAYQDVWKIVQAQADLFNNGAPDPTVGSTGVIRTGEPDIFASPYGTSFSFSQIVNAYRNETVDASQIANSNTQYVVTGIRIDSENIGSAASFRFVEWGDPTFDPDGG